MEQIKQVNREAYDWLVALDKHEWTLHAMDPTVKCAQVTSNFVESFNNWIGPLRSAPPMTLLDEYRAKISYSKGGNLLRKQKVHYPQE